MRYGSAKFTVQFKLNVYSIVFCDVLNYIAEAIYPFGCDLPSPLWLKMLTSY